MITNSTATWHYGIVAQFWAEFNLDGPEIEYYRERIRRFGEPALDVACGTGRLLVPYLESGLDVDGCDTSADMLMWCERRARALGRAPRLYEQPMHELALPRRYRTVFVCGSFGLGGDREHDVCALRRLHAHLEPGGTLLVDNYLPWNSRSEWAYFLPENRRKLPEPLPEPYEPRSVSDGSAIRLRGRVLAFDPLEQVITREMVAERFRDGRLDAEERYTLRERLYFKSELGVMLDAAGFGDVRVEAGYTGADATADDGIVVFIATRA